MTGRITAGGAALLFVIALQVKDLPAAKRHSGSGAHLTDAAFASLRLAINDLSDTYGSHYPRGAKLLRRLDALEKSFRADDKTAARKLAALREEALLANPLLDFDKLILLKWRRGQLGLPVNHKCTLMNINGIHFTSRTILLQVPQIRVHSWFFSPDADDLIRRSLQRKQVGT
jgi:hypothetical protein